MMKKTIASLALLLNVISVVSSTSAHAAPIVEMHGFVRLDTQYNDRIPQVFPGVPYPEAYTVPTNDQLECKHSQTLIDTRLTRLNVTALYDELSQVSAFGMIEIDFLNESTFTIDPRNLTEAATGTFRNVFMVNGDSRFINNFVPRLRLAFMQIDFSSNVYVVAGQFWTQFVSTEIADPQILDPVGPAGYTVVRQPQLALGYKVPFSGCLGNLGFVASVEKQAISRLERERRAYLHPLNQDENQGYAQAYPLFVTRVGWYNFKPVQLEAAAAGTQDRFVLVGSGNFPQTRQEFPFYKRKAWGGQFTLQSEWGNFIVFGRYRYLDGLNRLSGTEFPDIVFQARVGQPLKLQTVRSHGGFVGATYKFVPTSFVTAIYGQTYGKEIPFSTFSTNPPPPPPAGTAPYTNNLLPGSGVARVRSYQLDIVHWFWCNFRVGAEFKRWEVKRFNKVKGHLDMASVALSYYF